MRKLLVLLFLFVFHLSCVREDVILIEVGEPKLVLDAAISPDREISARITKTSGTGGHLSSFEVKEPATIHVYINDVFKGSMIPVDTTGTGEYSDFRLVSRRYFIPDVIPDAGDDVRIEAAVKGYETVSARTKIPDAPELMSIDTVRYLVNVWNEERIRLYVKLKDKPQERNYYRIVLNNIFVVDEEDSQTPESDPDNPGGFNYGYDYGFNSFMWNIDFEDPVFTSDLPFNTHVETNMNLFGIFSDNLFDGKEYTLKLSCPVTKYWLSFEDEKPVLKIQVKLYSISEDYYTYYKQSNLLYFSVGSIQLTPAKEYAETYSNVQNGFGLTFSYNEILQEIEVDYELIEDGEN